MAKQYQDPWEELVVGCLGRILLVGMLMGAMLVGIVWGIVEICQAIF